MRRSWNKHTGACSSGQKEGLHRSDYSPSYLSSEFVLSVEIIALDRLKTLWLCTAYAYAGYCKYLLLKTKNLISSKLKETCIKILNNTCVCFKFFNNWDFAWWQQRCINSELISSTLLLLHRSDWRQTAQRKLNLKGCMFFASNSPQHVQLSFKHLNCIQMTDFSMVLFSNHSWYTSLPLQAQENIICQ